jgi:hypothetical protein
MAAGLKFVLIDVTNGATTSDGGKLTQPILAQMAAILTVYANRDVASEYGGEHLVRAGSSDTDIEPGEIPFRIGATLADAPGAIAYHDVTAQGAPDAFDAITLSDSLLGPGNSLLVALSHEVAETIGDEGCNLLAAGTDGKGYAREACDPVESSSYLIEVGSASGYCSDFVLRSYFVPNHPGPFNFMSSKGLPGAVACPGPLQIAPAGGGNYQIVYSSVGSEAQVTGSISPHRARKKAHPTSRTSRRGVVVRPLRAA